MTLLLEYGASGTLDVQFGQIWAFRRRLDDGSDKFERKSESFVRTKTTRYPKRLIRPPL